jgi:hypothetical protein
MPVILLLLGVVTAAGGLVLVASGINVHEATFDTEGITPGTIAAVGGLLLIGMGFAVRELQRIERTLAARPMPRINRAGETTFAASVAPEPLDEPVRIPFPPKPTANPQAASASASPAPATTEVEASELLRVKFPTVARLEKSTPVAEVADVSLTVAPQARAEEDISEAKTAMAAGRSGNGAAPARVAPRFDLKARPAAAPVRAKGPVFNALLSAGTRQDTQMPPPHAAAPLGSEPSPVNQAVSEPAAAEERVAMPAPVSVLKSGVVEGMAYTLYSDGSIEAQLPQGTLRFGSITALRDHIESGS